jgi:hypothetical protein
MKTKFGIRFASEHQYDYFMLTLFYILFALNFLAFFNTTIIFWYCIGIFSWIFLGAIKRTNWGKFESGNFSARCIWYNGGLVLFSVLVIIIHALLSV